MRLVFNPDQRMKLLSSAPLAAWFLAWTGLALTCEWDEQNQTVIPQSADHVERIPEVTDPQGCQAACCGRLDCDVAWMGFPQDGDAQCVLVRCPSGCTFETSDQFKVFRLRKQAAPPADGPWAVPLLGASEPDQGSHVICRQAMKVGPCRGFIKRYYYSVTSQSCQVFIYGGCKANGNNFVTKDECEATCTNVTGSVLPDDSTPAPPHSDVKAARQAPPYEILRNESTAESQPTASESAAAPTEKTAEDFAERCGAEPDVGPCKAAFQHWYYNRETTSCQPFIYGGCSGNKNNYVSKESCTAACTVTVFPSAKKADVGHGDDDDYREHCLVSPDAGPCRAAMPMFYYHPITGTCRSFIYGGCRGNNNRYSSMDDCMDRCNIVGRLDRHGRSQNRWTAGFFLFITLAAISALLLLAFIIVMLRRRSLYRRPSSISDKQELLPDPDEQTSVDSLSLPESPKLNKA